MRPKLKLLDEALVTRIVDEAREVLKTVGVEIHNDPVVSRLSDHGATLNNGRVRLTDELIDSALGSVPSSFELYDSAGNLSHRLAGDNVSFTPGTAAINVLDGASGEIRKPDTSDYLRYARVVSGLGNIASQSTAMIPADVPEDISDSYRLYLSLLCCAKPVVTGAFTIEAFEIMKDLQLAVRGSREELAAKPLTVFSACPTSPIKWSDVTSQNVVDCATWGIPVEFIAMPLSGFMAPVTLVGTLVQHTAETLSGLVISQLTQPGAPVLYGGSPAIFDLRYETTPMGAIETMMIICGYAQIGESLGMPTQGYISLSDAKMLDAQAGLESGIGAALAALTGINSISGPGMLDFESCQSLEKLVVDNEICGMALRLVEGIEPREDFPATPLIEELLREQHLLISDHTRRHLRDEIKFPGPVIERANRARWLDEGERTLGQRAAGEIERLLASWEPPPLPDDVTHELTRVMEAGAAHCGMDKLPDRITD
jgi:trimethylamine--corrinoid protein Co-methyltransferase